jgi:adenylate cyclase
VQAAIYVPLERGEEVLGVIYVDNYYARDAFSATDLELLRAIANQVALFLRDRFMIRERREDQQILESLARQFPPHMLEQIREKARWKRFGGERVNPVTLLMADVRGFTSLTREMDPDAIVHMLNEMFDALVPIIFEYEGMVDKFIGDCILAVFGSPQADKQQWEKALRAGLQMQEAIRMLGEGRRARRLPVFDVGIGIHSGEIIHGFIGSAERMEYTVIGETVNRVSRYCDGAEAGQLLISKEVYEHVYRMVRVQSKRIRGKHTDTEPDLEGYVVLGLK